MEALSRLSLLHQNSGATITAAGSGGGTWVRGAVAGEQPRPAFLQSWEGVVAYRGGLGGEAAAEGPLAGAASFSTSFPLVSPPGRLDEAGLVQQHWVGAAAGVGALRCDGGGAAVDLGGGGLAASALWTPRAAFAADGVGPLPTCFPNAWPGEVDARQMPSEIHDRRCSCCCA